MARPEAKIDLAELEKLCGMQCAGWGKGSAYVSSRLSPVSSLNSCTVYRRSIGAAWVSGHPAVLGFAGAALWPAWSAAGGDLNQSLFPVTTRL